MNINLIYLWIARKIIIIEYLLTLLIIIFLSYKRITENYIGEWLSLLLLSIGEFYEWIMIIYVNRCK